MSNHHPRPWLAAVLSLFFVLTFGFRMVFEDPLKDGQIGFKRVAGVGGDEVAVRRARRSTTCGCASGWAIPCSRPWCRSRARRRYPADVTL
jgi:hypothetical protein